jgi:hypothetical protein
MARFAEPTAEEEAEWAIWVASRPPIVREIATKFPPWELFRLKTTGHRVTVHSFFDDGTVSVDVRAEFNFVLHERNVFGIDPDDLEPCDLPSEGEMTGALLSHEEVEENVDALRVMIRPDLWAMGPDGKARRKQ